MTRLSRNRISYVLLAIAVLLVCVVIILTKPGLRVNRKSELMSVDVPLHGAIADGESLDRIEEIIRQRPNSVNIDFPFFGGTPLELAVSWKRRDVVELLIQEGADVDLALRRFREYGDDEATAFLNEACSAIEGAPGAHEDGTENDAPGGNEAGRPDAHL